MDSPDQALSYLEVVGSRFERYRGVTQPWLEHLRRAEVDHLGHSPELIDRLSHTLTMNPELSALVGYLTVAQTREAEQLRDIPPDQAVLVAPHRDFTEAMKVGLDLEAAARAADGNAPYQRMCGEIVERLYNQMHAIRAAVDAAKEAAQARRLEGMA